MSKIAIIIPSRLDAQRLPNKPLKLINKKEMILHVYDLAHKSQLGEVIVATPDKKIMDIVKAHGGECVMTESNHKTGTDRVFEVFERVLKKEAEIIINLQGDMPNLDSSAIKILINHMKKKTCDIGTLASKLEGNFEKNDPNICKVVSNTELKSNTFGDALDFYRLSEEPITNFIYHHIGIYAFTNKALMRYVSLKRTKLEIERKLEQLRALENKMKINIGYIDSCPLSVDTEKDLVNVKKIMEI
jgi:3-deoxy-manno-octulosonate cytidylyltransferase (CMP-KDO synthetase)